MWNLLDSWLHFDLGEGAFYAVFGFLFVFAGIAFLILFFTLFGAAMKRAGEHKNKRGEATRESAVGELPAVEEGISPETVAVITAAIAAYYEAAPQKCDFVVRRIKRR